MIAAEVQAGIESKNILLGGFSQGGALALYSALTYPETLAGVAALSCWLPLHKSFPAAMRCSDALKVGNFCNMYVLSSTKNAILLKVLQCHGDCDPVVPYKWGQMTASVLKTLLKSTDFQTYRGLMHTSSEEELHDIKKFIESNLSQ